MCYVEEKYFKGLHDKPEGKVPLIRLKPRWDNIKIDVSEMTLGGGAWTGLAWFRIGKSSGLL